MPKAMIIRIVVAIACFTATGCTSHDVVKSFFKKPIETRVERLRQYSLEDQYKIFRRGMDHFEPPAIELADPIAERGAAAIPFLLQQLEHEVDDVGVRDILQILDDMTYRKSYDVAADTALMTALTSRISAIKNKRLQETCLKMLQYTR
jgi:hypothetical protein